jgi:hypothetical protein
VISFPSAHVVQIKSFREIFMANKIIDDFLIISN